MESVLSKIIEELINYLPLWYIILLAIVIIAMRFYYVRFKPIEEKTRHADCLNNKSNIDALKDDVKVVKGDLQDIKMELVLIKGLLAQKYPKSADIFSMKKSPRRLNELGEKLYNDIKGESFLNENLDFLLAKIDEAKPLTALDVEKASLMVLTSAMNNDFFNRLKDFVYNSPSIIVNNKDGEGYSYDITMSDVCFVLSIPLRDRYLSIHKELLGGDN